MVLPLPVLLRHRVPLVRGGSLTGRRILMNEPNCRLQPFDYGYGNRRPLRDWLVLYDLLCRGYWYYWTGG